MEQDQIKKAIDLCSALEVRALGDIAKRAKDPKTLLTAADLRLIRETKAGLGGELESGHSDSPAQSYPRSLLAWVTPQECARAIGVSDRWIRDWISGRKQCTPQLESQLKAGKPHVQVGPAYTHITKHCRRYPAGLHEPSGYRKPGETPRVDFKALGDDPHKILAAGFSDWETFDQLTPEQWRVIISAGAELRAKQKADLDAKHLMAPDDALKMLQSLRAVFVEHMEEVAAARLAVRLNRYINQVFNNIDLAQANPNAVQLLEIPILEDANETLKAIDKNIQEQTEGVRKLEGVV